MAEPSIQEGSNEYPVSDDNLAELARLREQDNYMSQHLRFNMPSSASFLPPSFTPAKGAKIVDLGCGPGGWAIEVAKAYPACTVIGIEKSEQRLEFAQMQTIAEQVKNVEFIQGDFRTLEKYIEEESIDFLHARFLAWFLDDYKAQVQQWLTRVKKGGIVCLVEGDIFQTTSESFEALLTYVNAAFTSSLQVKRIQGQMSLPMYLRATLQRLGLANIQEVAHVINFSAGVADRETFLRDITYSFQSVSGPLARKMSGEQQTDELLKNILHDFWDDPHFVGIEYYMSAYGTKP